MCAKDAKGRSFTLSTPCYDNDISIILRVRFSGGEGCFLWVFYFVDIDNSNDYLAKIKLKQNGKTIQTNSILQFKVYRVIISHELYGRFYL